MIPDKRYRSIASMVSLACTLEVMAPKAGNVYPGKEFDDLGVVDFLLASKACSSVLAGAGELRVGQLVLASIQQSVQVTRSNANLGIVILLSPLAKAAAVSSDCPNLAALRERLTQQLRALDARDSEDVYAAIGLANAGGLGEQTDYDVNQSDVPGNLLEAMALARQRDRIALQYCTDYQCVFEEIAPTIESAIREQGDVLAGISLAQLQILAQTPDSLIARKCGAAIAEQASARARELLEAGTCTVETQQWKEFDAWLRSDGNRKNPGTTADLIAAGLFVLMVTGQFDLLVQK